MSYQVYLSDHFLRQLKFYLKRYPHLKDDFIKALKEFSLQTSIRLGRKLYKIRLKSRDVPKGKSKSFRAILFNLRMKTMIVPISVYFKGDRADISAKEIEYHLEMTLLEIKKKRIT